MRRLDGSVAEVFLDAEHVDPGLGNGEADGHVLARDLAVLAADVARHQHVGAQFDARAADAERGPQLQRQFAVLRRTHAEPQQLDVARVRWLEPGFPFVCLLVFIFFLHINRIRNLVSIDRAFFISTL